MSIIFIGYHNISRCSRMTLMLKPVKSFLKIREVCEWLLLFNSLLDDYSWGKNLVGTWFSGKKYVLLFLYFCLSSLILFKSVLCLPTED